jgi:hypothetical protein
MKQTAALCLLLIAGFFQSCKSPSHITIETETFKRSNFSASDFLQQIYPAQIEGKSRVILRQQSKQERGIAQFSSNSSETHFTLKSGLGFNGGWMYLTADSVFVYDRIENQMFLYSRLDARVADLPLANLSLFEVFYPGLSYSEAKRNWESSTYVRSLLQNGNELLVRKADSTLVQAYLSEENGQGWFCRYENWVKTSEHLYPSKIEILSSDGLTNIFILTQEASSSNKTKSLRPKLIRSS